MFTEEMAGKIVYRLAALGCVSILVVALALAWEWGLVPRKIASTGTIQTSDGKNLETREFYRHTRVGRLTLPTERPTAWEVKLPSGRWIDCRPDCLIAYDNTE